MTWLDIAAYCILLAGAMRFLMAFSEIIASEKSVPADWQQVGIDLSIGFVIFGIGIFAWRFAEAGKAFVEALK